MIRNRDALARSPAHELALDCLERGIEAAHPRQVVRDAVAVTDDTLRIAEATYDLSAYDEVVVLGGGKAAATVAAALEDVLGDRLAGGAVVTETPVDTDRVEVLPGTHPVPGEEGVASTRRVLDLAREADERTLVLAVITGGGSALLVAPDGVTLDELRTTTDALLDSGASIHEINAVRKHLSAVKGGRLARTAAPATVATLVLSDVVGNDLDVIASGPTVADPTTYGDALAVLDRYDVDAPAGVRDHLAAGARGETAETPDEASTEGPDASPTETPDPGDPVFDRVSTHVLADGFTALTAAREVARDRGYEPMILSSRVRGEARESALTHVAVAEECAATGNPLAPPAVVLSGGELTVTVRGEGTGGPSQEFALRAAVDLPESDAVVAAVDTDGRDGATDAAGAIVDGDTVEDPGAALAALADNDATPYLDARDALVHTGRTGTNVNDLRVLVVPDADGGA